MLLLEEGQQLPARPLAEGWERALQEGLSHLQSLQGLLGVKETPR